MAHGRRTQMKMSEETFDFVCTSCARDNKTVEAVKYCVECSGYCCTDAHKKFPALIGHNLMEVSQGQQASGNQSILLELPTERCSIHKAKVVDMYCGSHEVVGCYICIATDHKSCEASHIHSIPDMIDTIFKLSDCKQTHSLLKDMMVSMDAVCKSKDTQLQTLDKAKKEALDSVTTFQKALETLIRKAAESSKQEVEAAYKDLVNEILQEKQTAEDICEDFKTTEHKLSKSEGNRAQKFVCSKLGDEQIKEAEREKVKLELHQTADIHISFVPNQELMESIKAAKGLGHIKKHGQRGTQKHDLYKIKGSRDINIKLSDDSSDCLSYGCCLTHDNQLLVPDSKNKKLKRIDLQNMSVVDYCTLIDGPNCVCCISKHEVAVACVMQIQFVSIHNKMTPTRRIKMAHICHGIAFNDSKLFVTDNDESLYVYDMTGNQLKKISQDHTGNQLFNHGRSITFNKCGSRMFVGGWNGGVICCDWIGTYLSSFKDIEYVDGVCVDGRGNMFVVCVSSNTVEQHSECGKKVGVVVKKGDGLQWPRSVCFHQGMNTLFVTMGDSNVVKMYELE